jgi:hypothetical protein
MSLSVVYPSGLTPVARFDDHAIYEPSGFLLLRAADLSISRDTRRNPHDYPPFEEWSGTTISVRVPGHLAEQRYHDREFGNAHFGSFILSVYNNDITASVRGLAR